MSRNIADIFVLPLALLASCDDTPGKWSAYVYPDARDPTKWERTDRFKTERMCRDAAREQIARLPQPNKAAFKCVELQPV
jgi:hypothetical protein